jgi:asparagine synthase (glutamine-hydrolysing)
MCGIVGFWLRNNNESSCKLKRMTDALIHRGPDGEGHWLSNNEVVGLGHRRLSIIDLSDNGAQPMKYNEDLIITFNGEIYNYIELKKELQLKGYSFITNSDTEVLLASYKLWGKDCLKRLDGMFAFTIYDISKNELFCARDRFGEKPFYYTFHDGNFYFASEMKAFWSIGIPKEIDYSMVYNFLVNNLVENPNDQTATFYSNIKKLKSSSYFIFNGYNEIIQKTYWNIDIENKYLDLSFESAAFKFNELLEQSISRRLRSDVPVGTSLSGGLDSSSIVSKVSKMKSDNFTFSARFPNFKNDEGKFIDIVSNKYSTKHHNIIVNAEMFKEDLDKIMYHQEEPFQSGSIYAQFKVYERARKENIIVMLDGQGADEFLCGYAKDFNLLISDFFPNFVKIKQHKSLVKINHNKNLIFPLNNIIVKYFPNLYNFMRGVKDNKSRVSPLGICEKFHKEFRPLKTPFHVFGGVSETLKHEMTNQGLEKLLKFADRNSMSHSVEVRLPFLSHELVEFIFSINKQFLMQNGWSKSILRKAMENDLPQEIVYRKDKIGFEAPTKLWEQDKSLKDLYFSSKEHLIKQRLITSEYDNGWKILVLNSFLNL